MVAAASYRASLEVNPRLADIWVQYGHALKESSRVADAEMAYRKALELDEQADTHLQLGHALKLRGLTEEAKASYLRAVNLDPDA